MEQTPPREETPRSSWRATIVVLGLGVSVILFQTLAVLPGPPALERFANILLLAAMLSVFPLVLCVLAFPVLLILAWFRRDRRSIRWLLLCIGTGLTLFLAFIAGDLIRRARFAAIAENSRPMIEKLEAHRAKNGSYPESIELPYTGLMAYPRYQYRLPSKEWKDRFEGYQLSIQCPQGAMSFDQFIYWPSKSYPPGAERIGDWAYVTD